jgi:superoxide dismutase, Fe-Mn family
MLKVPFNRRKFIGDSLKTAAVLSIPSVLASACSGSKNSAAAVVNGINSFTQQPLPYPYNAFEQVIDAKTMELHYSKHAAGYVNNLNNAFATEKISVKNMETLLSNISNYSAVVRNNAGGHFNHEMFWQCLTASETDKKMPELLEQKLVQNFISVAEFKTQFVNAAKAVFGSGWAWLCVEEKTGKLFISTTPNQDNPLMNVAVKQGVPILGVDVWEHAYYLKYQNKRVDYLNNILQIVNWKYVESRRLGAFAAC